MSDIEIDKSETSMDFQTVPMLACASPTQHQSMTTQTTTAAPKFGTMIPSRIFVGGIDFKTSEEDLREFFSKYGSVRDARIIRDRAEVSKGYGFVTYDSQDSVDNALKDSDNLNLHGKKLNIGRAVRKQPPMQPGYTDPNAMMNTWMYHPGGYASLTGQTGVTYFVAPTNQIPQFPGYSVNQSGIIPPYTYVRNCQTTASQYNNQIMRQMIPFSGTISPYYTAAHPATQSQQLQYHLQYQQHMQQYQHQQQPVYPEYIPAEGESVESYDEGGYKTLHFGDISSQLTPPDTPQEL